MIPKHRLEELKGESIRIFIKDLPELHCVQIGKIETVGEHVVVIKDRDHGNLIFIPLENIAYLKTL